MSLSDERTVDSSCGPHSSRNDSPFEVVSTVLRLGALARAHFSEVLKPHGMSWARYEVLELLCRNGPSSYRELAMELGRHRTSIKSTVAMLEESGYVARSSDLRWQQRLLVEATDTGILAVARAEKALQRSTIPQTSAGQQQATIDTLRTLESSWSRSRTGPSTR